MRTYFERILDKIPKAEWGAWSLRTCKWWHHQPRTCPSSCSTWGRGNHIQERWMSGIFLSLHYRGWYYLQQTGSRHWWSHSGSAYQLCGPCFPNTFSSWITFERHLVSHGNFCSKKKWFQFDGITYRSIICLRKTTEKITPRTFSFWNWCCRVWMKLPDQVLNWDVGTHCIWYQWVILVIGHTWLLCLQLVWTFLFLSMGFSSFSKFDQITSYVWGFLDLQVEATSAQMNRSFRNVPRRATSQSDCTGICHLCLAGRPGFDYEDLFLSIH